MQEEIQDPAATPRPPPSPPAAASGRDAARENNFDFLRLGLATLVIFSHNYMLTGRSDDELVAHYSAGVYSFGHLAVDGFFAISGYLITQSWLSSPRLGRYLSKRILRICPGFWVATLFCVFIAAPLLADSARAYFSVFSFHRFFLRLVLLQGMVVPAAAFTHLPHVAVNGSLWTIQYEFLCYLCIPLFAWLGFLTHRWRVLALFVACFLGYVGVFGSVDYAISTLTLELLIQQLMFFLSGMLLYLWRDKIVLSDRLGWTCAAVLVAAIFLGHPGWVTPFVVAPLVMWVAFHPKIKLHHVGKYGDFSYGIYLYAYPVQQFLVLHGVRNLLALFIAAFIITFFIAVVSWHWVEGPALKLKNAKITSLAGGLAARGAALPRPQSK